MTGKEKCRLLRQIRQQIADANGIAYDSPECTYPGNDCPGTCPQCDAEIRYLDLELNRKAAAGEKITISGLSLDTYLEQVTQSPQIPEPGWGDNPVGMLGPYEIEGYMEIQNWDDEELVDL